MPNSDDDEHVLYQDFTSGISTSAPTNGETVVLLSHFEDQDGEEIELMVKPACAIESRIWRRYSCEKNKAGRFSETPASPEMAAKRGWKYCGLFHKTGFQFLEGVF